MEIRARYDANSFPAMDGAAHAAAGRISDFSGMGFGERELGWICKSEIEALGIKLRLDKIGLRTEIWTDEAE